MEAAPGSTWPPFGWTKTTVRPETANAYAPVIADLDQALVLWRREEAATTAGGGGGAKSRNLIPATCPCGRRLRVAPSTLAVAPIVCGACRGEFQPDRG